MKRTLYALLTVLALACHTHAQEEEQPLVYVVPIKDMIERGLAHFITRALSEAKDAGMDALVIDMNTPGGRLDATKHIIDAISDLDVPTYTFVNSDAISAGAITALATDGIFMAPGGLIGDAMPIMMSPLPMGGAQELSGEMREKITAPTAALIRSVAERNGHDADLAEAMVRPENEYKIGEEVICAEGELLTLTSKEAARVVGEDKRPLLSRGTVDSIEDLLTAVGIENARIVRVTPTLAEKIARTVEGFPLSGILLALGLLGIYIEVRSPGFGFPGIAGACLLMLWFWGHHIAGLAGMAELVMFVAGMILLMLEIFVIPGFGIAGIMGIALLIGSIGLAMVEHYPGTPVYRIPDVDMHTAILNMSSAILLTCLFGWAAGRYLPRMPMFNWLVLQTETAHDDGFTAAPIQDDLIGSTGLAETDLRPGGIVSIGDRRLNVVTRGTFIDRASPIVVAEVHGSRIVVESHETASDEPEEGLET